MKHLFLATAMLVAIFGLAGQPALASCAAVSQQAYIDQADSIVHARVDSRSVTGLQSFTVLRILKGRDLGSTFTLSYPVTSTTSVDVQWKTGEEYVVYLRSDFGRLSTNVCMGTRLWSERSPALISLEPGRQPQMNWVMTVQQLFTLFMGVGLGFGLLVWKSGRHAATRTS